MALKVSPCFSVIPKTGPSHYHPVRDGSEWGFVHVWGRFLSGQPKQKRMVLLQGGVATHSHPKFTGFEGFFAPPPPPQAKL